MTRLIQARNVEAALHEGLWVLQCYAKNPQPTRNGPAYVAPWPVITETARPQERVILAPWRDANPFFHLVESAWMLAGRDDVAFLTPYVKTMVQYAQQDGTVHGAYGKRWRRSFGIDQLNVVVRRLKANPDDRQCVIQMWDCDVLNETGLGPRADLTGLGDLGDQGWRDRPCNTHCYLRVCETVETDYETPVPLGAGRLTKKVQVLDLMVCCRSNDMLWGAHGANAVHFSYLLEYLADRIGVGVGTMVQVSFNYHGYVDKIDAVNAKRREMNHYKSATRYDSGEVRPQPMRLSGEPSIDEDLPRLCAVLDALHEGDNIPPVWKPSTAFARVVRLAAIAHSFFRRNQISAAIAAAGNIEATDWRAACVEWLDRRARAKVGLEASHAAAE